MLAVILLIASSLFWSGNFFFGKVAHITDLTPFKLSFFRWSLNFTIGDIWMFAAVISWCLYSVLLKKMDTSIPQLASLEVMIIIGLFFIIPFYLFESFNGTFLLSSSYDFFIIIYVAIFASIAAYFAWNKGVYLIGPNRAGLFLHFIPVFAAIWAITFLNESFAIFHIVGVFFIITGIILSNIRFKNEQNSQN